MCIRDRGIAKHASGHRLGIVWHVHGRISAPETVVAQRRTDCTLHGAGRGGHHGNWNHLELLDTHKQKTMEQFVHLRGNGLFLGIVCIVLLPDRRAGLETVDFFLPRNRVEFHHDLSGATNRRVRRHCEFLFRRGGFPLSRSDSTGDQQRRLCRHMLAVSLFSLPKKHILESLTHLKWPAVSSNTSQRSSAEISIKANYTGDWEILSSALRLIQNHKTNQKVKVLN